MLSKKTIRKFKKTFKKEFNVELSDKEACESATKLVSYFELLIEIDRKQKIVKRWINER